MTGRTIGNLILITLVCVAIFVTFMAIRPAPAGETPGFTENTINNFEVGRYAGDSETNNRKSAERQLCF